MDLAATLAELAKGLDRREVAPGVHAFAERRPKGRVRSYTTASMAPFADRTVQELILLGHLHLKEGRVARVEGFNGAEGARWAERASLLLRERGLLAPDGEVRAETPLRGCPYAMR